MIVYKSEYILKFNTIMDILIDTTASISEKNIFRQEKKITSCIDDWKLGRPGFKNHVWNFLEMCS